MFPFPRGLEESSCLLKRETNSSVWQEELVALPLTYDWCLLPRPVLPEPLISSHMPAHVPPFSHLILCATVAFKRCIFFFPINSRAAIPIHSQILYISSFPLAANSTHPLWNLNSTPPPHPTPTPLPFPRKQVSGISLTIL